MIKHFCDGCQKEIKSYATIIIAPKWFRAPKGDASFRYELCDQCYDKLGNIVLDIPENSSEVRA